MDLYVSQPIERGLRDGRPVQRDVECEKRRINRITPPPRHQEKFQAHQSLQLLHKRMWEKEELDFNFYFILF